MNYYILSLYHSYRNDKHFTLWRPNNASYCYSKESAGLYQAPEKGYHDSDRNMPIEEGLANTMFEKVDWEGEILLMIPINRKNMNTLGLHWKKKELHRKTIIQQTKASTI